MATDRGCRARLRHGRDRPQDRVDRDDRLDGRESDAGLAQGLRSVRPFEYPHPDWGDAVQLLGACEYEPPSTVAMDWLDEINVPIVVVTTSSEHQNDHTLGTTAMQALADQPVHVVATFPSGVPDGLDVPSNATALRFVPHGALLDRAVCAVTHGGMGATQKALARGVPVCVVPYGRDQLEVARRVQVSRSGTRLPAKRLTAPRLKAKVQQAMSMTDGARRVATLAPDLARTSRRRPPRTPARWRAPRRWG